MNATAKVLVEEAEALEQTSAEKTPKLKLHRQTLRELKENDIHAFATGPVCSFTETNCATCNTCWSDCGSCALC